MILVLNCGSQSIKWKLFDERLRKKKEGKRDVFNSKKYQEGLMAELGKIKSLPVVKVGHRVVHGGEKFRDPVGVNDKVLKDLQKYNKLAPLHNPFNLLGIKVAQKVFPKAQQVAVFDTGFFKSLPEKAYLYPLPEKIRKKYGFRRYGFHGISHEYVAKEGAKKIGKSFEKLKIITCHLGGGASICAIDKGKVIDTSMGFTPLEGLMMMTRGGDIDPGIVIQLCQDFSSKGAKEILNKESGIKAICGFSDMKDVLRREKKGDKKSKLALEVFAYRVRKYIGAYFAVLGGCDLLVFTGSIGSGWPRTRNLICRGFSVLKDTRILPIETEEELMIARKIKERI